MKINLKSNKYQFITQEQEIALVTEYQKTKSEKSATALISAYMRLIDSMAYKRRNDSRDHDDLVQEGVVGFLKALDSFDLSRGLRLSTYVTYYISYAMYEFIINNIGKFKFGQSKPNKKIFFNISKYRNQQGRITESNIKKMAIDLDVPESDIRNMDQYLNLQFLVDDGSNSSKDGIYSIVDESNDIETVIENKKLHDMESFGIMNALNEFDTRVADVIQQRYFNDVPATMMELGKKHKVSTERIRQIEVRGIKFLRSKFNQEGIRS